MEIDEEALEAAWSAALSGSKITQINIGMPLPDVEAAITAYLTALKEKGMVIEQGWQPIETADKDKEILVAFDEPFFGKMTKEVTIAVFDTDIGKVMFGAPRRELLRATHWRPLSDPPTASARKGGG